MATTEGVTVTMTGRVGPGVGAYPPPATMQPASRRSAADPGQLPVLASPRAAQTRPALDTSVVSPLGFLLARADELIRNGGTLALVGDGTAFSRIRADGTTTTSHLGIPFTPSGMPDFDAVRRAGGKVEGGVPGGFDICGWNGGGNSVSFYAAQVTPPGVFVKGMVLTCESKDPDDRRQFVQDASAYLLGLPSTAAQARSSEYSRRPTFIATVG